MDRFWELSKSVGGPIPAAIQLGLAGLSLLTLIVFMLVPDRHLFFIEGSPNIFFASPLVIIIAALTFLGWRAIAFFQQENLAGDGYVGVKKFLKANFPLLAFTFFNIAFVMIAFMNSHFWGSPFRDMSLRWWLNYFTLVVAIPSAWYLGRKVAWLNNKVIGAVLAAGLSLMTLLLLFEFLHLSGFQNFIGLWLERINSDAGYAVWIWNTMEPVRAQGLGRFPGLYAAATLFAFCWALSSLGMKNVRSFVLVLSVFACYLTGTRSLFLAFAFAALVYLFAQARERRLLAMIKRNFVRVILISATIFLLMGSVFLLTGMDNLTRGVSESTLSSGALTSVGNSVNSLSNQEQVPAELHQANSQDLMIWLYSFTSGRTEVWSDVVYVIEDNPLGVWDASQNVVSGHAHNEILDRLLTAGPISLFLYVLFLWWVAIKVRAPLASTFPAVFVAALIGFGLFDVVFAQIVYAPVGFYLLGYLTSDRNRTLEKSVNLES